MFISTLDLFKVGIGPSSSHTMGPMEAAVDFRNRMAEWMNDHSDDDQPYRVRCTLKGSLAFTGKGHATDNAVVLGLHGYQPKSLASVNVPEKLKAIQEKSAINVVYRTTDQTQPSTQFSIHFQHDQDVVFDFGEPLSEHPNGMIFELLQQDTVVLSETYFSIGGGFITTLSDINALEAPLKILDAEHCPYGFESAKTMLQMSRTNGLSIAEMKYKNELSYYPQEELDSQLDILWQAMKNCVELGLDAEGELPGELHIQRRARKLYEQLKPTDASCTVNDWLCAYAMAVNEENAAGHMVVTAPTNGAAGVVPSVLYYFMKHESGTIKDAREFLLTAGAIGGLIKHKSSISGAEVGCQGEVGSAAAMAAAGLCAVRGGSPEQVENAAEIALEHHLGMTCDPVAGLVQVPCIERNGFGAIKAFTAANLALRGSGQHFMPLDNCIEAMKQTGLEMSHKYKETSLGGLAVSITEC